MMTLEDIRRILAHKVAESGPVQIGREMGVSHQYIRQCLNSGASISENIINKLGFETAYRKIK